VEAVYLDLHIHTSQNPNGLNSDYDVELLLAQIKKVSKDSSFLISLTDHNVVNKKAYIELKKRTNMFILGVELHIKNYDEKPPYHCHIFINLPDIIEQDIDQINTILFSLYPDKEVTPKTDLPNIETIIRRFEGYDFMLLPHGGQSHSTFDKSVSSKAQFDSTLERSIYYNQFDGFTARNSNGLNTTVSYFKRLGISEFVNLVTCTDNYNPKKYPDAKHKDAKPFVPTWMFALPTFSGLRLSLSESDRFVYAEKKPANWAEYIKNVRLKNSKVDIDVELSPGLNVVIGGSSSGKTLFVDSIYRKLAGTFDDCDYADFHVEDIRVVHPSQCKPHYINQNYIIKVIDKKDEENSISDIDILKKVFPEDSAVDRKIGKTLANLKKDIANLMSYVRNIEAEETTIYRIPIITSLIQKGKAVVNPVDCLLPNEEQVQAAEYPKDFLDDHIDSLDEIHNFVNENCFITSIDKEIEAIKKKLLLGFEISQLEAAVRDVLHCAKTDFDTQLSAENEEQRSKKNNFEKLLKAIKVYLRNEKLFRQKLKKIISYSVVLETKKVESMGHSLYVENDFTLNKEVFKVVINKYMKSDRKIERIEDLKPKNLFYENFSQKSPKVHNYDDFEKKIYSEFEKLNLRKFRITTDDGRDYDELSAGWKTSVILDLILGFEGDIAPLIIDQPEDNLATGYINSGLIKAIKKVKRKKQIILVSHNATIPMLGDAQTVVLCKIDGKIVIRSNPLEGAIGGKSLVDFIAEITDGGKPSIKKRVKKYNLKSFRE